MVLFWLLVWFLTPENKNIVYTFLYWFSVQIVMIFIILGHFGVLAFILDTVILAVQILSDTGIWCFEVLLTVRE